MQSLTQKQIDRFWGKVDKEKSTTFYNGTRCWEWVAGRIPSGYGTFDIGGKTELSHRVVWVIANGEIPDNLWILHHCDNPLCVNLSHLFLGTVQDNSDDKMSKGRQARGDKSGSRLHPESRPRGNKHYSRLFPEKLSHGDDHYSRICPEKLARGDRHGARLHPEKLARGEDHGNVKLTQSQVEEIRRRYKRWGIGGDSAYTLSKEFGVSQAHIGRIVKYKSWK